MSEQSLARSMSTISRTHSNILSHHVLLYARDVVNYKPVVASGGSEQT